MEVGNLVLVLKRIVNQWTFGSWKNKSSLILSSLLLSYIDVKFGDTKSLENHGEKLNKSKSVL